MESLHEEVSDWQAFVFDKVVVSAMAQRHRLMVRTLAGGAASVRNALAHLPKTLILGVIAGNDAVLAVCTNASAASRLVAFLGGRSSGEDSWLASPAHTGQAIG